MIERDTPIVSLQLIPRNNRLVEARKEEKGFTQKDLSYLTGIPSSTIGHIETLRIIPSREVMEELASALGKSVEYLFPPELMQALKDGAFLQRKAYLETEGLAALTETRRLGLRPALTSGITEGEKNTEKSLLKEEIRQILTNFTPRDQRVIVLRFGLDGGDAKTLERVGQEFDLGRERIRQIESRVLRKLRHPARSRILKEYLD